MSIDTDFDGDKCFPRIDADPIAPRADADTAGAIAWQHEDDPRECISDLKKRDMIEYNGTPGRKAAKKYSIPCFAATPTSSVASKPVAYLYEHATYPADYKRFVSFERTDHSKDFVCRPLVCAPSVADAAGASEPNRWQKAQAAFGGGAAGASERADAEKDAALTDEQIVAIESEMFPDGVGFYEDDLIRFARAILAANKEKP